MKKSKIIFLLVLSIVCIYYSSKSSDQIGGWHGLHFRIYCNAAAGDFTTSYPAYNNDTWIYNNKIAWLFKPFLLVPFETSLRLWEAVLIMCFLVISYRMLAYRFGWMAILVFLKPFIWSLQTGNIYPLLIALSLTPVGALIAGCVKPIFFGIFLMYAMMSYVRHGSIERVATGGLTRITMPDMSRQYGSKVVQQQY
jgi:hypothetical protein